MKIILEAIDDNLNKADGGENEIWHLIRACSGLAMVVKTQQAEIATLKAQVERLAARVGPVVADGSNLGRSKLFKT